jgi:hypothetical protein
MFALPANPPGADDRLGARENSGGGGDQLTMKLGDRHSLSFRSSRLLHSEYLQLLQLTKECRRVILHCLQKQAASVGVRMADHPAHRATSL